MKINGYRLAGSVLCCLLTLAACADAFAQGPPPGGGGFPGGRPGGGRPPGGPGGGLPPPGGPRRVDEHGPRRGAEQGPPPDGHRPPPFGPRADLLSAEMRFGDRPVKGAPYSAQFVSESTRVLADGTRITHKSSGAVYRSADGRTRREMTLDAVGPVAVEPVQMVFINDPDARSHYALDVGRHVARRLPLPEPSNVLAAVAIPGADGDGFEVEQLGRRTVEGVEAEGNRTTITVPAGRVGNDRPLEFVTENWYSSELQVLVLSIHKDPYVGDNVYRLTNVVRTEPAPALFEVPADYKVAEGPPPPTRPRKPRQ
jgi:hypothetical protein